jgi:hypothetical protein
LLGVAALSRRVGVDAAGAVTVGGTTSIAGFGATLVGAAGVAGTTRGGAGRVTGFGLTAGGVTEIGNGMTTVGVTSARSRLRQSTRDSIAENATANIAAVTATEIAALGQGFAVAAE